jgi:hydroxymethylbilane synthase
MTLPLRIGTRGSALALWQARHVAARLQVAVPDKPIELIEIETAGDQVREQPLAQIGGEGVFTKAIQDALLSGLVDVAVHSLKDLPTLAVAGLVLASVPARGPTGDALVSKRHASFAALPKGAIVATGSLRRQAQLRHRRPDLQLVSIRGNVETRLRKLDENQLDAVILAQAGLERLGLTGQIREVLDASWIFPAVGQGALGLECREQDTAARELLERINDDPTHQAVLAERAMLRELGGGCHVPVGAVSTVQGGELRLRGVVLAPDGSRRIESQIGGPVGEAEKLGQQLARDLLGQGARQLLAAQ